MNEKLGGAELFGKDGAGIVVGAHAPFLDHHIAFGRILFVGDEKAGHAVGFKLHHEL